MRSILIFFLFLSGLAHASSLTPLPFDEGAVKEDFVRILREAQFPTDSFKLEFTEGKNSFTFLSCANETFNIKVVSPVSEMTSTFYKAVRELGFLFPHPMVQISPTPDVLLKNCGKSWQWKPTLQYRGFHLHTLHPNEWVAAFFQNESTIAEATMRWLARNQQNIVDLSLLDVPDQEIEKQMKPAFQLARKLQIHTGLSLGIALNQQNSYKLLSLWDSYFGWNSDKKVTNGLRRIFKLLPLSYVVLEAGTSEFTPTDYEKSLRWLDLSARIARENKAQMFTKVHVSSNQVSKRYGNYNFLPQYSKDYVGVLPHTVMFYGIVDPMAPMYGNKHFHGIRDFMMKEKTKRPTWYYPETSYWVGMDVDVPLFLTDYLRTRALDMKFLAMNKIEGQLNFSSGHVLGYWLFDWNLSLMADAEYAFNPLTGLRLLGEDTAEWQKMIDYQAKWFKELQVIRLISSANLQDELSGTHRIHDRNTMRDLSGNETALRAEVALLQSALKAWPEVKVKNRELREMLDITRLRMEHALAIREKNFEAAADARLGAELKIKELMPLPGNYPNLPLFKVWKNPTAYQFGYVYPAAILYFWSREERQRKEDSLFHYFPFRGNMYDVWDIVF